MRLFKSLNTNHDELEAMIRLAESLERKKMAQDAGRMRVSRVGMAGSKRSGFVVPLAVLGFLSVGFMIATLTVLNQGNRTGALQASQRQHCFLIAWSAYNRMLARFQENTWDNRPCRAGAFREWDVPALGGAFDAEVVDAAGTTDQVDITVRARFQEKAQVYAWRVRMAKDTLKVAGRFQQIFFTDLPAPALTGPLPLAPGGIPVGAYLDQLLTARSTNDAFAEQMARSIKSLRDPTSIAEALGARKPNSPLLSSKKRQVAPSVAGLDKLTPIYPDPAADDLIARIARADQPVVASAAVVRTATHEFKIVQFHPAAALSAVNCPNRGSFVVVAERTQEFPSERVFYQTLCPTCQSPLQMELITCVWCERSIPIGDYAATRDAFYASLKRETCTGPRTDGKPDQGPGTQGQGQAPQ